MLEDQNPAPSRRQLLKAGAWAAPVIVLATAAPAAAAGSTPVPPPAHRFSATITVDASSSSSANGSISFTALTSVPSGTVLTITISPVTTLTQLFQIQANLTPGFLHVPDSGSSTTKTPNTNKAITAGATDSVSFNFSGYFGQTVTITVSDGTDVLATRTF